MTDRNDSLIQDTTPQGERENPTLPSLAAIDKPVKPEVALRLIRQTAVALSEASQSGFVHQNLRPETILIQPDDLPVRLNFDAVPPPPEVEDWDRRYLSPEQKAGKALDSRSNIFTLGIILQELIFGFHPDEAPQQEPETETPGDGRPAVSRQTLRLIETCCRKEPWARYQSLKELTTALDRALRAETTGPDSPTPPPAVPEKTAVLGPKKDGPFLNGRLAANSRLVPIGLTIIFLALLALAMVNSWSQGGSSSTIPIFQQLPLLLGGENSPALLTRQSEGATATIRALQIRLPSRTPTPSPTSAADQPDDAGEPPVAGAITETPTPADTPTPTATSTTTNPPPPPSPVPTETPTQTAVPPSSPTTNPATPPFPGITNTPVPPSPTSPPEPEPTDLPEPTNTVPPTPTPPPPPTPTPPVFPTSTPPPTLPPI